MTLQSQAKEAAHNAKVLSHQVGLTNKLRQLENRCEAMEKSEMQMRLDPSASFCSRTECAYRYHRETSIRALA